MRKVVFLTFCGLMAAPLGANAQDQLPPGPGSDTVIRVCTACHGTSEFTSEQHDADGWAAVVSQMIGEGANATDDEQTQIINYLATNYPAPGAAAPAAAAPAAGAAPAAPAAGAPAAAPAGGSTAPAAPAGGSTAPMPPATPPAQ